MSICMYTNICIFIYTNIYISKYMYTYMEQIHNNEYLKYTNT